MKATMYTQDADGRDIQVGDNVRLRLSRLNEYDVREDERHGSLGLIGTSNKSIITISLPSGELIVETDDVRSDEPSYADEGDGEEGDCGSVGCTICKFKQGVDADGASVNVGTNVRVRLSKLEKYASLGVTSRSNAKDGNPEGRGGVVFGVATDGALAITLFNGEHFVFNANDVRVNTIS